jgi:Uma2 family endonuclease
MQSLGTRPLLVDISHITLRLTHQEFEQLCQDNPDLRLELEANGDLITMVPVALTSSEMNGDLFGAVWAWNRQTKSGRTFDSSGGFTLPNGAVRSPDVTWVGQPKADEIPSGITFPELVPDFIIELRSKSDSLTTLRKKMEEYQANGVHLGWLINPQQQQVEMYRPGQPVEVLQSPRSLDGGDVLPGFTIDLSSIF